MVVFLILICVHYNTQSCQSVSQLLYSSVQHACNQFTLTSFSQLNKLQIMYTSIYSQLAFIRVTLTLHCSQQREASTPSPLHTVCIPVACSVHCSSSKHPTASWHRHHTTISLALCTTESPAYSRHHSKSCHQSSHHRPTPIKYTCTGCECSIDQTYSVSHILPIESQHY